MTGVGKDERGMERKEKDDKRRGRWRFKKGKDEN